MKQQTKHVYDIELNDVYKRYCNGIEQVVLKSNNDKAYHISLLKNSIDYFKSLKGIDNDFDFVIVEQNEDAYSMFLAQLLLFYDLHEIKLLLDYHYKLYKGKKQEIINIIEFGTLPIIKVSSVFENQQRLDRVSDWIRERQEKLINKLQDKEDKPTARLVWESSDFLLDTLSKKLYESEYTSNEDDFKNVFKYSKKIKWKKDYQYLVYMMSVLYSKRDKVFRLSHGKAYLQAIGNYFQDATSKNRKVVNVRQMTNMLYNMTERKPVSSSNTIDKVKLLLKEIGIIK